MKKLIGTTLSLMLFTPAANALLLGDPENGKKLQSEKCSSCHISQFGGDGTKMYSRNDRKTKTIEGLMLRVAACNQNTEAGFNEDEINDVIIFLNENYYKFED